MRTFNVSVVQNGESVQCNDRPISFQAAIKFSDSLRKSGININTIKIVPATQKDHDMADIKMRLGMLF